MSGRARRPRRLGGAGSEQLARGLGWFSIGLGLTQLLAPQALTRGVGLHGQERLIAGMGAREVATGIGILASRDPTPWIWARVAGDALDLGTAALGLGRRDGRRGETGLALAALVGVTLLDVACARGLGARRQARARARVADYSGRSGLPQPAAAMRGAARDFAVPEDMRTPEALRPWTSAA